jgi:hypothetical protein
MEDGFYSPSFIIEAEQRALVHQLRRRLVAMDAARRP